MCLRLKSSQLSFLEKRFQILTKLHEDYAVTTFQVACLALILVGVESVAQVLKLS